MNTVYSVGYSGFPIEAFAALVAQHDLTVVDVRYRPFSRNPAYSRSALERRFGSRYVHIAALGNRNYKGGPIALVDARRGLAAVTALLAGGSIVLFCVCADWRTCHRTVITGRLATAGYPIQRPRP